MHKNRPRGNLRICCGANKRAQRFYTESTGENSISSSIIGFYDLKQRAVDRAGRPSHNERSQNAAPVRAVSLFHAINYKMDPKWGHVIQRFATVRRKLMPKSTLQPRNPYRTRYRPTMLIIVIDSPQTLYHVHWYQILLFCPGVLYLSPPHHKPTHHHAHYRTCLLFFTVIYLLC